MRSRSVRELSRLTPWRALGVLFLGLSAGGTFAGCSGPGFEAGGAAGGTSHAGAGRGGLPGAGTANGGTGGGVVAGRSGRTGRGGASAGGAAGRAPAGGTSGSAGESSAGEAGAGGAGAGDGCACGPGQYCRAGQCLDCADLSQLAFDAPEPILDHPTAALRYPRPGDVPGSLFFTLESATTSELWYEASIDDPPGAALDAAPAPARAALLYVDGQKASGFQLLFTEKATLGPRTLRTASFDGHALTALADAPVPLGPSGFDDYSSALASSTGRAYWMTTRDGAPSLYTGVLGNAAAAHVELDVAAESAPGKGCAWQGDDAAPWVRPDGSLLLVSALPLSATCEPLDADATDLFAVPLNPTTGAPLSAAIALSGINVTSGASSETDAALSSDLCTIYFASDGGSARSFDFRLFRASRR